MTGMRLGELADIIEEEAVGLQRLPNQRLGRELSPLGAAIIALEAGQALIVEGLNAKDHHNAQVLAGSITFRHPEHRFRTWTVKQPDGSRVLCITRRQPTEEHDD